jgi:hypothetical protein
VIGIFFRNPSYVDPFALDAQGKDKDRVVLLNIDRRKDPPLFAVDLFFLEAYR